MHTQRHTHKHTHIHTHTHTNTHTHMYVDFLVKNNFKKAGMMPTLSHPK